MRCASEEKGEERRGLKKLLVVAVLHTLAVWCFTSGFLLSRKQIETKASLSHAIEQQQAQYDKVVLIVVDALRSDFVCTTNHTSVPEATRQHRSTLGVFEELWRDPQGGRCEVFEFKADAPTTTMQRLKGLMTGSLPTFVDIGSSLSAKEMDEDNLVYQLNQAGKRVVFMGDETWSDLFPQQLAEQFPFPSMEVNDLDTVDRGIMSLMVPRIESSSVNSSTEEDWDVLIAHFLGVDHAGHTFDIHSSQMLDKLEYVDDAIRQVVGALREKAAKKEKAFERTLLLVMGDHGQTEAGEHGGNSHEETSTVLLAYKINGGNNENENPPQGKEENFRCPKFMSQLDFAATFSAILGLPIPFSNVGQVSWDLWSMGVVDESVPMNNALAEDETETLTLERLFDRILEQNSNQVNQYLEAYLKHGGSTTGGGSSTSSSDRQFLSYKSAHEANIREIGSSSDSSSSSERLRHSMKERQNYLDTVAGHARHIWTKFDFRFMFAGVVFALSALLIQVREVRRSFLESSNMEENAKKKVLLAPAATLLYCLSVLILSLSMLSNSYILSEGYVVCFLITTLLLFLAREAVVMGHQAAPVWLAGLVALNCLLCNLIPEHTGDIWNGQTQKASYQVNHVVSDSAFLFVVYLGLIQMRKRKQPIFGFNPKEALFFYNSCLAVAYSFLKRSGHGNNPDQIWHPDNLAKQVHLLTLLSLVLTVYESKVGWKTKRTQKNKSRLSFAVRSLFSLLPELYMLQIGNGGFALSLAFLQIFFSTILCAKLKFLQGRRDLELVCILVFGLYCTQIFYATGHQCQFSSLQYNAAFVGFKTFSWWRGAVLLSANTWSSHILVTFFLVVLYAKREGKAKANAFVTFGLVQSAKYLAVLVCAMLHRRHLMVWGVFAPKFVFDSVALITLDCLLLFTYTL